MNNNLIIGAVAIALLVGLGVYAMSGSQTEETVQTNASPTPTPPQQKVTPNVANETIVDVAVANDEFSTLVTALTAADLVDTLAGKGPFTVFAPTNAAFNALPEGTLETLLADKKALAKVLTYHVVPGKVTSSEVVKLSEATTVEGQKVNIKVEGGKVYINESLVTQTDIEASNGIIHVIDAVLLPQ